MNHHWDESTGESTIARIEEILCGKADGKGYTDEELDAYFKESNERMSKIATREDFNRGIDMLLRKQAEILALLTRMEQRLERDNVNRSTPGES